MGSTLMDAEFAAKSPRFSAKLTVGIFSTLMDAEIAAKSPQFPQIPAESAKFAGGIFCDIDGRGYCGKISAISANSSGISGICGNREKWVKICGIVALHGCGSKKSIYAQVCPIVYCFFLDFRTDFLYVFVRKIILGAIIFKCRKTLKL